MADRWFSVAPHQILTVSAPGVVDMNATWRHHGGRMKAKLRKPFTWSSCHAASAHQQSARGIVLSTLRFGEPVPGYAMALGHVFVS